MMPQRGDYYSNRRTPSFFTTLPITKVILLLLVASFIGNLVTQDSLSAWLAFYPRVSLLAVTGLFTYPWAVGSSGHDIINLLFAGYLFYQFGGSLERSWLPHRFLLFLLMANVAAVLLWELGCALFGVLGWLVIPWPIAVGGPWLMVASVTTAWAWLNADEDVSLWFVVNVKARWIAWLTIAFLALSMPYGLVPGLLFLLLSPFTLGGVIVAFLYARWERRWGWIPRQPRGTKRSPAPPRPPQPPRKRVTLLDRLLAPFREWQRRRAIARIKKNWKFDD